MRDSPLHSAVPAFAQTSGSSCCESLRRKQTENVLMIEMEVMKVVKTKRSFFDER